MYALSTRTIALSVVSYLYVCAMDSNRLKTRESSVSLRLASSRLDSKPSCGKPTADVSTTTASTMVSRRGAAACGQRSGQLSPAPTSSLQEATEKAATATTNIES